MGAIHPLAAVRSDAAIVSTAVLRAGDHLALSGRELAAIIGVSPSQVSRANQGTTVVARDDSPAFQLALLLLRVYRSLQGLFGDQQSLHRHWLRTPNTALGGVPAELMRSIHGLVHCADYLDALRGQ